MSRESQTWQSIRQHVERRLVDGVWKPGETIPSEQYLAQEFKCARATVNRALQSLASDGILERRRKAGTRVARQPRQRATFDIPLIKAEVETTGARYRYALLRKRNVRTPRKIYARLGLDQAVRMIHLRALHFADDVPHCLEDRWINPDVIADLNSVDFAQTSANEFLLQNVPLSKGDLSVEATTPGPQDAELLKVSATASVLKLTRSTWSNAVPVTTVTLAFAPGYRMLSSL